MNRAQLRKEARRKTPKPNRSCAKYSNNFTLEFESFDSIERLFQQLRNGVLSYDDDGFCIMGLSGEMLHIESALAGWCDYWKTLTEQNGIQYDDAALELLRLALKNDKSDRLEWAGKKITNKQIDAAYEVIKTQRQLYRQMPKSITTKVAQEVKSNIRKVEEIRELLMEAAA